MATSFDRHAMAHELHELLELPLQRRPIGQTGSGTWYEPHTGVLIIDTIFRTIADALHRGETVRIRGFGEFRPVTSRGASRFRPFIAHTTRYATQSTKTVEVEPIRTVRFIPSPYFEASINLARGFKLTRQQRRSLNKWKYAPPNSHLTL